MPPIGPKRYDAFLSFNSLDRQAVRQVAERLKGERLEIYLEEWEIAPGREFQTALAEGLRDSKTCVVFLGPNGLGPWQKQELQVAIDTRARDEAFRVIPVLLPGTERPRRGDVAHLEFLINASWVEFLRTLDDERVFRSLKWGITGEKPPQMDPTRYEGICPYRGLEVFRPEDEKFFFGRANLTGWLVSALRHQVRAEQGVRFLGVLGPSGSGKSSVVLAGMVPRLRAGAIEGSERWPIAILRPGDDPLVSLSEKIVPLLRTEVRPDPSLSESGEQKELLADLRSEDDAAVTELSRYVGRKFADEPEDRRLVIVVDQFEEVFTYRPQDDQARRRFEQVRDAFLANLLHAAAAPRGRVAVVLTMRSDFLGACASFPQLSAVLSAHQELVGPMTPAELREAIERPAFLVGCEVEPGLTERLLADVKGQPGALPLLQFALTEVWKERDVRKLSLRAYDELGGVSGALEHRANEIYGHLNPVDQELSRRLFLRLVQPGEGTEDTKRRVSYRELLPDDPARAEAVRKLVQTLASRDARLITTEGTDASDGAVEVAHEALIRGWGQLRQWIEAERSGLRTQRRLTEAAQEWAAVDPQAKDDYLFSGARLALSREWASAHRDELSAFEAAFLAASEEAVRRRDQGELEGERRLREAAEEAQAAERRRANHEAEAARRLRHRLWAMIGATAAAVLAAGLAFYLWDDAKHQRTLALQKAKAAEKAEGNEKAERIIAQRETKRALAQERLAESRRLAALSDSVRPQRLDLAMLLALEASKEDTLEARGSVQRSLDLRPEVSRFLHVPEGDVSSVAFDKDGRIAAGYSVLGGVGGGVVLFDPRGERTRPEPLAVTEGDVSSVAFDKDGRLAAGYGVGGVGVRERGGVVLFDARGVRTRPGPLAIEEGYVTSVAFDKDGRIAAGYSGRRVDGGGVVLFDARWVRLRPEPLAVEEGDVLSVAFAPDGRIAAGYRVGGVGGVVLLDAQGQRTRPEPLVITEGRVTSVAFDKDGRLAAGYNVVIGGGNVGVGVGGVVLFDAHGERTPPEPLKVREGDVTSVAFAPDGRIAAGYSVRGGVGGVILFDPRGDRTRSEPLAVTEGEVSSVDFAPDGRIAAGYSGRGGVGGVILFDPRGERTPPEPLKVHEGDVTSVAFAPDGRIAAGHDARGGVGGGVALFDARGVRTPPEPLKVHEGHVTSVAVDKDGRIAAGYDGRGDGVRGGVVLFDARGVRTPPGPLAVHEGFVTSVAFAPDGRIAAGHDARGGVGGGVVLFDARGVRTPPGPLAVKESVVTSVAVDKDGRIAAGYDVGGGGVVLFDAQGLRTRPEPLAVQEGLVTSVAFGPGGRIAAGYSGRVEGGGVVLFDARGERLRPEPLAVEEGDVMSVAFDKDGRIAAGYRVGGDGGGVVLFDADPASWRRIAWQVANRNFTRAEWGQYFPGASYRRTIRSLPWPHDLPDEERKRAEMSEKEHLEGKVAA